MITWGKLKCWLRGNHSWKLHWNQHEYRDRTQYILVASECVGCGKYRPA